MQNENISATDGKDYSESEDEMQDIQQSPTYLGTKAPVSFHHNDTFDVGGQARKK